MESKPFEKITITDITNTANINRGTFYLHYQDKFDLLDKMEQQLFTYLGSHLNQLQSHYSFTKIFEKEQEQLATTLFRFIKHHAPILKIFLSNHGRAGFHIRLRNAFSEKVRLNLETNEKFHLHAEIPLEYFLSFITAAFLGLIEQWIQNNLDKTPKEMTDIYIHLISYIQST